MKRRLSFVIALCMALCLILSGCAGSADKEEISYAETVETENADRLFEQDDRISLKNLCETMSENNDNPQSRDNFFRYILAKTGEIYETGDENKYEAGIEVLSKCLQMPLTSQEVMNGLRVNYLLISDSLTQKSEEYIIGKWKRLDSTLLTGTIIEVLRDEENGLIAKISSVPDDVTSFKSGDIKWINIQFSNYKKMLFSDLNTSESTNKKTYYKNDDNSAKMYNGASAIIDFENDTITVEYDKSDLLTNGNRQTWVKMGTSHENNRISDLKSDDGQTNLDSDQSVQSPSNNSERQPGFSKSEGISDGALKNWQ